MAFERNIDKKDHNAKILKNKHQARSIAKASYQLLDKEEKGVLNQNDLENFKLFIGRNPKKDSILKIMESHGDKSTFEHKTVSKEESKKLENDLIKENNSLYRKAKSRGYALDNEIIRCREIMMELRKKGFFRG